MDAVGDHPEDVLITGNCSWSYDWIRAAIAFCLQHFNLLGPFKRHGFATLVLLVGFPVCLQFVWTDYFAQGRGYLQAINYDEDLEASLYCNAVDGCHFYQPEACKEPIVLRQGENTSIAASDCQWEVMVICASDFDSKRTAFALMNFVDNMTDLQDLPVVEQETLRVAALSKTIDETMVPPAESWSLNVWSSFKHYDQCGEYQDRDDRVCSGYTLLFDPKVYTISPNHEVAAVNIFSGTMWFWLIFALMLWVSLGFFDAASELQFEFGKKED